MTQKIIGNVSLSKAVYEFKERGESEVDVLMTQLTRALETKK